MLWLPLLEGGGSLNLMLETFSLAPVARPHRDGQTRPLRAAGSPGISRLDRADGGHAHAGAFHRPGLDVRAKVRRHPSDRIQAGRRRSTVLTDAKGEGAPRHRRRRGGAAGRRRDPRRRSGMGRTHRVSRIRRHLDRRPRRHATSAHRAPACSRRAAAPGADATRHGARRFGAVGTSVRRGLGRRDREATRFAVRAQAIEALAQDEVRVDARLRRRRVHRRAGQARRIGRAYSSATSRATISSLPARSAPGSTPSC